MLSAKQKAEQKAVRAELKKVLLENLTLSNKDIASHFIEISGTKLSFHRIRQMAGEIREELPITPETQIETALLKRREKAERKESDGMQSALLKVIEDLQAQNDFLLGISKPPKPYIIKPVYSKDKNEATVLFMLSDWHFEERVDAKTINGLNEYNLDIASARWDKCAQNFLKLVKKERQHSAIDNIILWLGGDFITGYIHEELEENNYLSPIEASLFAKGKLVALIELMRKAFKHVHVVCNFGNHGRMHKKPRVSTGYKNSFEWMIYHDLHRHYQDTDVTFQIPDGMYNYVEIYDKVLRTAHGDHISYGGGIGGLTVPLIKAIMRADEQRKADYNIIGHFHQFWQAAKNCDVNGSGIGFNAYAQHIGARPEEPMQGMLLFDKKYGLVQRMPVFCQ